MKTGIMIISPEEDLKTINISRINKLGEDWVKNSSDTINETDVKDYIELLVEGIATVIQCAHDNGIFTDVEMLKGTISKLEESVFRVADTNISKIPKQIIVQHNSNGLTNQRDE